MPDELKFQVFKLRVYLEMLHGSGVKLRNAIFWLIEALEDKPDDLAAKNKFKQFEKENPHFKNVD